MSRFSDCKGCLCKSSQPMATPYFEEDTQQHPLITPDIPPTHLTMALHRRRNNWHLVWARGYGMACSKHVATLNHPKYADLDVSPPSSGAHRRFWFNSGIPFLASLENLLQAEPPIIRLTGRSRTEKTAADESGEEIVVKEVEVLICDAGLSRKCVFCGVWEGGEDFETSGRFHRVGMDKDDPLYWCGSGECVQDKTENLSEMKRKIWRREAEPPWIEYFGLW